MFRIGLVVTSILPIVISGCGVDEKGAENRKRLIGIWVDAVDGDRIYEFHQDGRYKSSSTQFGIVLVEGTFQVRGDELTAYWNDGKSQAAKLQKLGDQELVYHVVVDDTRIETRLKRVK